MTIYPTGTVWTASTFDNLDMGSYGAGGYWCDSSRDPTGSGIAVLDQINYTLPTYDADAAAAFDAWWKKFRNVAKRIIEGRPANPNYGQPTTTIGIRG